MEGQVSGRNVGTTLGREKSGWRVGRGRDGSREKEEERSACRDMVGRGRARGQDGTWKGKVGMESRERSGWESGKGREEVGMSGYGRDEEGQRSGWESGRQGDRSRDRGKKREVGIHWEGFRREKLGWESREGEVGRGRDGTGRSRGRDGTQEEGGIEVGIGSKSG
ncbi:hypothetical protein CBR_g39042 [Chara braunii]|uniref:Uncharacterized protein n=1 Tax=Chara braunii TaxID=69332 RepID=A0A388LQT0_CHABU|nr:hypothetical protein CBR_g39042 [Chara braunii]|eukprot:GBG84667.1 hypothetical protein CBR_g39042 [Chara braunii]